MPTILITGANRGIGLAHAELYAAAGARVFAAVRAPDEADDLKRLAAASDGRVTILPYDAADPSAPAALKAALGETPIDVLLNNAGIYGGDKQSFGAIDADTFITTIRINTLGPLLLAQALSDNVAASQQRVIANQSSQMGSISDNGSGGFYAYRASKAALNMVTMSLARDLKSRGICVVALHPGWVRTRMGGGNAPVEVEASAKGQQAVIAGLDATKSGGFFTYTGAALPW